MKPMKFKLVLDSREHPFNEGEQVGFVQTESICLDISAVENDFYTRADFEKHLKLIAAAPDLLRSVKSLVELADLYIQNGKINSSVIDAKELIKQLNEEQ